MVSRFAATLRRQLYKDHLGLSTPELCPPVSDEPVTAAMRPVGTLHDDATGSQEDELVMVRRHLFLGPSVSCPRHGL